MSGESIERDHFRLAEVIQRYAREAPDRPVLEFRGRSVSWRELDDRSNRMANGLRGLGVAAQDRVAILDQNSHVNFDVLFGTAKLNAIMVGINWRLAPPEIARVLDIADCSVVFVSAPYEQTLREAIALMTSKPTVMKLGDPGATPVDTQAVDDWLTEQDATPPDVAPGSDDDIALLVFTSGTTGEPKGAMLTNRGYDVATPALAKIWGYDDDSLNLMAMPLYHSSISWVFVAMFAGVPTLITRGIVPEELAAILRTRPVTHTFLVPSVVSQLCDLLEGTSQPPSALKVLLYGSAPITIETLRRGVATFGECFTQCYGLTEALTGLTQLDPVDHVLEGLAVSRLASCGKPYPHVELQVVDPKSGKPVPVGVTGEVWARSEQIMSGYWRRPEETAATITPDKWLRTGDAGHLDADGYLYLTDRLKDVIISGGENIYPVEVENVLSTHPAVRDVSVIGVPDARWGEAVKAVVVLATEDASEAELIAYARDRIAHYKCPKSVAFVDELPRNPSGKVLKRELRRVFSSAPD